MAFRTGSNISRNVKSHLNLIKIKSRPPCANTESGRLSPKQMSNNNPSNVIIHSFVWVGNRIPKKECIFYAKKETRPTYMG